MSGNLKVLLVTVSALALMPVAAQAQTDDNVTIVEPGEDAAEDAAEAAGDAAEDAAEATEDAAEAAGEATGDAAEATVDAADDAADATAEAAGDAADAAEDAAEATADAADDATDAAADAAEDAADATEDAMDEADADVTVVEPDDSEIDVEVTETDETAEGTPVEGQIFRQDEDTFLASTMMDGTVMNAAGEQIGDVNDMVLSGEGQVQGVVIGVGGFLGIGEKNVAIELGRIEISEDEGGELSFMLDATQEELEAAPEFVTEAEAEAEAEADAEQATGTTGMTGTGGTTPATTQ